MRLGDLCATHSTETCWLWLVRGASCNAWLFRCEQDDWIPSRGLFISSIVVPRHRFTVVVPILQHKVCCVAVYVQTLLMIGRTGFKESTGIFWARHARLEPKSNIRAVSVRAVLLQKSHVHASMHPCFQVRDRPFVASSSSALKYTVLSTP